MKTTLPFILSFFLLALTGCGGNGGGVTNPDPDPDPDPKDEYLVVSKDGRNLVFSRFEDDEMTSSTTVHTMANPIVKISVTADASTINVFDGETFSIFTQSGDMIETHSIPGESPSLFAGQFLTYHKEVDGEMQVFRRNRTTGDEMQLSVANCQFPVPGDPTNEECYLSSDASTPLGDVLAARVYTKRAVQAEPKESIGFFENAINDDVRELGNSLSFAGTNTCHPHAASAVGERVGLNCTQNGADYAFMYPLEGSAAHPRFDGHYNIAPLYPVTSSPLWCMDAPVSGEGVCYDVVTNSGTPALRFSVQGNGMKVIAL